MNDQFKNQVAIITGAGQGIGLEIARHLAAQGVSVVLNDLEEALANEAADSIRREKGSCVPVVGDVADISFVQSLVDQTVKQFGRIDMAIANAGITLFGDFFDYDPEDFRQVMAVNLGGGFFLTQAAARQMKTQESGGSILLMSSVTGHQAHQNLAAYGMSKAALEMLARNLVIDLSPFRININAIAPGATITERTKADPEYEKVWSRLTPMGRPATTGDIATAAVFLLSPQARHITGQTLVIDGGWTSVSPSPY
jgi:glucose 1-dehydrogenase